ncbi:MAG TPA: hypothetical protein VGE66_00855 [Chitinophagaceae bacterium]
MRTLLVQRIIRRSSIVACIIGLLLCVAFYVEKDVELGTFLYFYLLITGVLAISSLVALLITGVLHWAERKGLLSTLAFIALLYVSLMAVVYFVYEVVEPITKYALP